MFGQGDERDTLLIDRAAAAEVPREDSVREWARDKRAFISSVMEELREERMAAADSVGSLGARPVMFEDFGGRDADPVDAYLGEVETSQIYVGILGQRYGRPLGTRFSATHTEFRHAEQQGLRVAAWALDTQEREGPQQAFLDEVRTFHVVPAFGSPADLRRQVSLPSVGPPPAGSGWQSPFLFVSPVLSQDRGRSCHSLHISSKPTAFGTSPLFKHRTIAHPHNP